MSESQTGEKQEMASSGMEIAAPSAFQAANANASQQNLLAATGQMNVTLDNKENISHQKIFPVETKIIDNGNLMVENDSVMN